jgi:hypothetical protein
LVKGRGSSVAGIYPLINRGKRESKRGASPSFFFFPLSFTLPQKERGIKGVRLISNLIFAVLPLHAGSAML